MLLAGFGSFPGAPINPARLLVETFDPASIEAGAAIPIALHRVVLPVEWGVSWAALEAAILRTGAVAVLVVGLSREAQRFLLETRALNERLTDCPDAAGRLAPTARIPDAPGAVEPRMPLGRIEARLREAGLDHALSGDAGRYLCNETLFQLCRHADALGLRQYGFVHTPWTREAAAAEPAVTSAHRVAASDLSRLVAIVLGAMAEEAQPVAAA